MREQIDEDLGLDPFEAVPVSAKSGIGIDKVLEGIVRALPAPTGDAGAPLKALVFDAHYDAYRGRGAVVPYSGRYAKRAAKGCGSCTPAKSTRCTKLATTG